MTAPAPSTLRDALFVAWTPPSRGSRSRALSTELGIDVHYISQTSRQGLLAAVVKYPVQAARTVALLVRKRPRIVLVQNPPSLAPLMVAVYAALTNARFVVDAHSDAMMSPIWTRPRWLYRLLARRALATLVTNEHFAETIRSWGGRALVIQDIPATFEAGEVALYGDFNVAVVNTFAPDEPLEEVVAAARDLPDVTFHVTGDPARAPDRVPADLPDNIRFTGFVPDPEYYGLLRATQAVMCLTTRDHTMQRGACEAVSLGTPIITSDWPILNDYFSMGTVYVDNTASGIRDGVLEMRSRLGEYERGIVELRGRQGEQWGAARSALLALLTEADSAG